MKKSTILMALCAATLGASATDMTEPMTLSDVSYRQDRHTQKVHVSYSLANQGEPAYVVMDVLTNGVSIGMENIKTFADASTVSQLDGAPVVEGTHEIVWNARKDWKGNLSTNAVVQLYAFYTNRFNIYMVIDLSAGPSAAHYPVTYTMDEPDPINDYSCISNKLWLKRVNAGEYTMGNSTESANPPHHVTLTRSFFAGVFPVTVAQYALVMNANKEFASIYDTSTPLLTPANVSWVDARGTAGIMTWPSSDEVSSDSFMGLLRTKTGISGFDLPTEAQWEYACRAGTVTDWNNGTACTAANDGSATDPELAKLGWYNQNNAGGIHRVGQKQPNDWGLYDFHGSCWEWCLDAVKTSLGTSAVTDPEIGYASANDPAQRIQRGGAYVSRAYFCRATSRNNDTPESRGYAGFRVWCNIGD